jgi:hypothetical protein
MVVQINILGYLDLDDMNLYIYIKHIDQWYFIE